jgi:hypothetical protein
VTRRETARWILAIAIGGAAIAVVAFGPITRGPGFHGYVDQRTWLGIPHVGDVLSNLAFFVAGIYFARVPAARTAAAGVIAIGIGSGAYHWAPSDETLAFDWGPIVITLSLVLAAVVEDRLGARAGRVAYALGPAAAIASVIAWYASGGTTGHGNMAPYVAVQAIGIALAPVIALIAPGEIRARWLLAAVAGFALARLLTASDGWFYDAIGISGHSIKHVAMAAAAALALRGLADRTRG